MSSNPRTTALSVTQQRRCSYGMRLVALYKCYMHLPLPHCRLVHVLAVKLRSSFSAYDQRRNGNKRPHSLVSISSSSSSSSSGFTSGLLGFQQAGALGDPTAFSQLATLTTMHESPLEMLASAAGPQLCHGAFDAAL